ncbi:concanavalin A-like lectin/glucanase domain-containing protein [Gigaspora rosea]|uniref:Concanavalin A-like lectin/glucanase domain-containing protein n=1 Tax=Gigaspora rosea TaxID=44941 RepID=A0A397UGR7_9GLOM|nr:concanavalin A-like lectin/glucanase domain-containing protein [Gigaspora rosea]
MIPLTWDANDKPAFLSVDSNELRVNYLGHNENDAVIRTNNPIPPQCKLFYFEINIINNAENGIIAIGFCKKSAELNKLPGYGKNSWGYHCDDGCLFECSEIEEPYGPKFKSRDTIGCCLNFRNNTVFYTKNGVNLGIAFRDLENSMEDPYYPCIGVSSKGCSISIEANFGNKKFEYTAITDNDIDDDRVKEEWIKVLKQCDNEDMIEVFISH